MPKIVLTLSLLAASCAAGDRSADRPGSPAPKLCKLDVDCRVGQSCVQAEGSFGAGVCGHAVDKKGNRLMGPTPRGLECTWHTDCPMFAECVEISMFKKVCIAR